MPGSEPVIKSVCMNAYITEWALRQFEWYRDNNKFITVSGLSLIHILRKNLKKLFSYYKPYMGIFVADMFFAFGAAAVSLVIPLVVRYITSEVVYWGSSQALHTLVQLGVFMLVLIAAQCYCNYFISNDGHVMGSRIEDDMGAAVSYTHLDVYKRQLQRWSRYICTRVSAVIPTISVLHILKSASQLRQCGCIKTDSALYPRRW